MGREETLTDKQLKFCNEYLIDFNGKQAAIRAGYAEKTADITASKLLRVSKVKEYLDSRKKEIVKASDISIQKVLNELAKIAFSNITDFIKVKGDEISLTDWTLLSKEQTACIESVSQTKEGYRLKLYNKPQALEMIGRHLGMFLEMVKDNPNEIPEFVSHSDAELDATIEKLNKKNGG